jgi:class 3 adenylate cyclase
MVHRLLARVRLILASRRSPDMRVRTGWWIAAFTLLGLVWLFPPTRLPVTVLWATVNICYVIGAIGWGCFHPRSLLSVREISLRWSVLLTLFAALIMFSQFYGVLDQVRPQTAGPNHIAAVLIVAVVLLCPVLFTLILGLGILGAMVGAFAMRRATNVKQATSSAVVFWYSASMILALWATVSQHRSDLRQMYAFSIPLLTVAFCRLADGREAPLTIAGHGLVQRVEAVLILRRLRRGRWRTLDLRGAALGLLAAVMMLGAPTALIKPLKTMALSILMQVRAASSSQIHLGDDGPIAQLAHRNDIVILDMDAAIRYQIVHGSSEAAVQAEIIDRLHKWGAGQIVLPSPLVHSKRYEPVTNQAPPDETAVSHCRRDIPLLSEAMKRAGDSLLFTLPPTHHRYIQTGSDYDALDDSLLEPLFQASSHIGAAELPLSDRVGLPIIPNRLSARHNTINVPVLIAMQRHRPARRSALTPVAPDADDFVVRRQTQDVPGHVESHEDTQATEIQPESQSVVANLPLISSEGVLVNFLGNGPQYDFEHIDYSTLLNNQLIHANGQDGAEGLGQGNWQTPQKFFHAGQTVFLDSVLHPLAMTPLGVMSQQEVLAYATATLLSQSSILPVTTASLVVVTLFMGLCIGATCFRRDPLDAIWRATIPMFLLAMISLCLFEFGGIWLDPILPLGTAIIALTLVTQLSFAQERSERRRTRALFQRFVASDQLDNWLAMPEDALALGGKRQTVCVLFADVRNFTRFAEQNEADKVIEVINVYMSGLTEALHRYGGVLDKYTGDGLMAWFPIQSDVQPDLKNAVSAALAMRDAALAISAQMPPGEQLDIGIGLHYGDAVVGLVGSEKLQINWTALGHTVVVSARLQTIAAGGEVVISESLYEALSGAFAVEEGQPVMVKGLSIPVRPYRVIGSASPDHEAPPSMPPPVRALPAPPEVGSRE